MQYSDSSRSHRKLPCALRLFTIPPDPHPRKMVSIDLIRGQRLDWVKASRLTSFLVGGTLDHGSSPSGETLSSPARSV